MHGDDFVDVRLGSEVLEVATDESRVACRGVVGHLGDALALRGCKQLVGFLVRECSGHPKEPCDPPAGDIEPLCFGILGRLGGDDVHSGDHIGLRAGVGRFEALAVQLDRLQQCARAKWEANP